MVGRRGRCDRITPPRSARAPEGWDPAVVIRRPACEAGAAATEYLDRHALRPKRVADDPSFCVIARPAISELMKRAKPVI